MKKGCTKHNRKNKFTPEEDERLRELVRELGEGDWDLIAKNMTKRNARQCHDRWIYYLSPNVNTSEWTKEEEQYLLKCIVEYGKKWTQIAKLFPGRNDIQIKNKWSSLRKRINVDPILDRAEERVQKEEPKIETAEQEVEETPLKEEIIEKELVDKVNEEPKLEKETKDFIDGFDFSFVEELFSNDYELDSYFY